MPLGLLQTLAAYGVSQLGKLMLYQLSYVRALADRIAGYPIRI